MFSSDSFKRKAEKAFAQRAGSTNALTAQGAHAAFLDMGGRPTLPLERVSSLMPTFTFGDTSLLSMSAFKKLVDYLCKGRNVQDELDAVYQKVAALKVENESVRRQLAEALQGIGGRHPIKRSDSPARDDAIRSIDLVLESQGDVFDAPSLLKLAWEHAAEVRNSRLAAQPEHASSLLSQHGHPQLQALRPEHEPARPSTWIEVPPSAELRKTASLPSHPVLSAAGANSDGSLGTHAVAVPTRAPSSASSRDVPPSVSSPDVLRFGCFLSHYKVEAASEARWLQQQLEPLLGQRCFLDSDDLRDLSRLRDHVRESSCLLFLQTRAVLTRPWCLVELLTAIDSKVPIIGVKILSGAHQYDFDAARNFMTHLETQLETPAREQLVAFGIDLIDAAFKLSNTLPHIVSASINMNESRTVLSAHVDDIVSAIGRATLPELPVDCEAWLAARGAAPRRCDGREVASCSALASIPPDVPTLPEALLPRPDIIATLKARVLDTTAASNETAVTAPPRTQGDLSNTTAAAGLGGVGKTCMAAALVRDEEVRLAFDKICWVSVGQEPDAASLQQTLHIQLVGQPLSDAAKTDERIALGELIEAAKGQAVLLVLDDGAIAPPTRNASATNRV